MVETTKAAACFFAFQQAMKAWELRFHPLMRLNALGYADDARSELASILHQHVRGEGKAVDRLTHVMVSSPPDYDPDADVIETIEGARTKVRITVRKTTQFGETFRYMLGEHEGRWMIETKEVLRDGGGRWRALSI